MKWVSKGLSILSAAWLASANAKAEKLPCEVDPILQRVAEEYVLDPKVTSEIVKARIQALGSDIAAFKVNRSKSLTPQKVRAYVRAKHVEFDAPVRCGVVFKNNVGMLIAAPKLGRLRVTAQGTRLQIAASWNNNYGDAELWIRLKSGQVEHRSLARTNAKSAKLDLVLSEPAARVQLLGTGKGGRRPLAERWLSASKSDVDSSASPETWLSQLRRAANVSPELNRHRILDAVAISHSQKACQQGRVVHNLGDGYVSERLEQHGVDAQSVGEVVGRAPTVREALQKLADSPAHYAVITDKKFTDWGVGVTSCKDKQHYVTLIFATEPQTMKR